MAVPPGHGTARVRAAPWSMRSRTSPPGPLPFPRHPALRTGVTLLELTVVLALAGLILGLTLPAGRGLLDRWAAGSVRDHALAALHRVRVEARIRGGATLRVDGRAGVLAAHAGDSLLWVRDEPAASGVHITHPDGAPAMDTLAFDALGLGIVTSRTLVFRRGRAEARLVISSRGRGSRR